MCTKVAFIVWVFILRIFKVWLIALGVWQIISHLRTYLGVKVAVNMMCINSWNEVIQNVTIKLSKWKANSLSVGGRLTLLKSVLGSLPTYYMSLFKAPDGVLSYLERLRNSFFLGAEMDERNMTWVCWRKVLAQKQYGGLGVSSLYALNRALLFKCIWHFFLLNQVSGLASSKLFTVLIDLLTGLPRHVPVVLFGSRFIKQSSLKSKVVDLLGFCKKVIGNGNNSNFWYDKCLGDVCFKVKFNSLFNLDLQKDASVAQKFQNSDFAVSFRRRPKGGIEESQFQELSLSLAFFGCSILFKRSLVLDVEWSW
ncbi:hypothetical protein Tco_1391218 [Tanacetum coccineum]